MGKYASTILIPNILHVTRISGLLIHLKIFFKMNNRDLSTNPFAALFTSVAQAQDFSLNKTAAPEPSDEISSLPIPKSPKQNPEEDIKKLAQAKSETDLMLQKIFLITLDKEADCHSGRPSRCVFLSELYDMLDQQTWLDFDSLGQAVFERLMLSSPGECVIKTGDPSVSDPRAASLAGEIEVLRYLTGCYIRTNQYANTKKASQENISKCREIILLNSRTCLQQPEIYFGQEPIQQLASLILESAEDLIMRDFLISVLVEVEARKEDGPIFGVIQPILDDLKRKITKEPTIFHVELHNVMNTVTFIVGSKIPCLSEAFLEYSKVTDIKNAKSFETTLLGSLLSLSCIVKNEAGPYEFFDKPSAQPAQEHNALEARIWERLALLNEKLYVIIYSLLSTKGDSKHLMLEWLGNCIHANAGRAKLWSSQMPQIYNQMNCSDGFFMNLCAVLLRLCQPFCAPENARKLMTVSPEYTITNVIDTQEGRARNVHMRGLVEETCLIPAVEGERVALDDASFNFITECFFITHRCLNLGFHVVNEKFVRLSSELHRMQRLFRDIQLQGATDLEPGQRVRERMDRGMTFYLCLKAALTEPRMLEMMGLLQTSTAKFLSHAASHKDRSQLLPISFPLCEEVPPCLTCLPEFVINNVIDYMIFLRRFKDENFELMGDSLEDLFTMILVFMGSPERMKNPHLRARLAEALEAFTPHKDDGNIGLSNFRREQIFLNHPHIEELARTLLHVFVSIEMTGQSVEFEQKFNYRHPMYMVLEHMWGIDIHKSVIQRLAQKAEGVMDAINPPLFLRFINILVNDAIFLLDEALSYLTQIKDQQDEKERGEWNALPADQRQERDMNYRHLEMLCRYHNSMGNDTVHTIEMMTGNIKTIWTHHVMVDRVAAMLNYFLLHLVGPKRKNFKVNNLDELEFKPQELVSNICKIYLNLGKDDKFCQAVSRDGRSYSPELFVQARDVLNRIRSPVYMVEELDRLAKKVQAFAEEQAEEDVYDAPEEFLDPIMGSLMKDPVMLPSSKQIVDRSTIARHILSDQFDPFNRDPLTMDMVLPQDDLKERIRSWLVEMKAEKS
ncbi:ubiquitin conjugation factor E4 A-like isoform X2 [Lineus longissimus]|uniref:ubiquitin conjugation factor E4 A-like isoform X2 n=2 Tax=Lineus longissimus TaxID=88925 RepID=UPI00315C8D42